MSTQIDSETLAAQLQRFLARLGSDVSSDDETVLLAELDSVSSAIGKRLQTADGERTALVKAIGLISEGVVVSDSDGILVHANELGERWLTDETGNSMAGDALNQVLQIAGAGQQTTRTLELLGPPRRSMSVTGLPVYNGDGAPAGAVAIIEDTTELRHLEAARRDFVANVSHELKTPIGALGLLADTLLLEKDPVVMDRLIQRMCVETQRVGQVIDDLLNLSRIESLRHVSAELVSAKGVVDQAIGRVRYAAEHRSIGIGVHGDLDATLYGGQRELVSALHHLLENALKYSNENSSVEVGIRADGDWTEVSVRDHGMGIAAQYLDRIFERFYRVDDARTRSTGTGGTGLGLSIVRHVVQSHGGEIRVTSQEGDGSTFTLRLASKPSAATERLVVEGGTDG